MAVRSSNVVLGSARELGGEFCIKYTAMESVLGISDWSDRRR